MNAGGGQPLPTFVVVGDATFDVHVTPAMPPAIGADVPATARLGPGGQGANLAVRLARQGLRVTLACALGDDVAGASIRAALEADGVILEARSVHATGVVVLVGGEDGERTMLSDRAALPPRVADFAEDRGAWLLLSGYPLLQPDAFELAHELAARPMRRVLVGCAVPDAGLDDWRGAARAYRPHLIVANRAERDRARLTELTDAIAVTDAAGAEMRVGLARARAATTPGPPAVDTTGAGDAFAVGLVAELARGPWPPTAETLQSALERGVALASAVAREHGAQARVAGERPVTLRP